MNGAEYIARFLKERGTRHVYLMTGGACAFIIDAIAREPGLDYVCMQHEQAAAFAADAVWRISGTPGVTVATSGPGATNLLTGIACSYFDSIPSIHITGQVNMAESAGYMGAKVRQAGFQETDIVAMAKPITKYAVQVHSAAELKAELVKAWNIAISGRMGPVLIDVPMNVQKEEAGDAVDYVPPVWPAPDAAAMAALKEKLGGFLAGAKRPVVLWGAGVGLSGAEGEVAAWLAATGLPFVSSWNGMTYFNHDMPNYCGQIGVYGNRGANSIVQNADAVLVLGSRLDNRQRSGNAKSFAPAGKVFVVDVDDQELAKYRADSYLTGAADLRFASSFLPPAGPPQNEWMDYVARLRAKHFGKNDSSFARANGTLSPYAVVERLNALVADDAIVAADTGATVCWMFQMFHRTRQTLFTAGGMSPMGYALPAAIAAAKESGRQVVCAIGDGGLQLNIQELQTVAHHKLPIKICLFNNEGYGIIRQFQDSYFAGRYEASERGYSTPDFGKVAAAYGIAYRKIERVEEMDAALLSDDGPILIEFALHPNTLIEPKLEMGRAIHDQFPYADRDTFKADNPYLEHKDG